MGIRSGLHRIGGGTACPYEVGQVLFESGTPGTYNLEVEFTGLYEIWICGAGGGGGKTSGMSSVKHRGGSAAAFQGVVKLKKGNFPLSIGERGNQGKYISTEGGASSIGEFIICGGGIGGFQGAAGGTLTINIEIVSSTIQSNGVAASSASVLGNGYGAGGYGNENGTWGTNGYIKIIYKK